MSLTAIFEHHHNSYSRFFFPPGRAKGRRAQQSDRQKGVGLTDWALYLIVLTVAAVATAAILEMA
jgi:hypothetical protein